MLAWYSTGDDLFRYEDYLSDANLARGAAMVVIEDEKDPSQARLAAQFSRQSRVCFGDVCRLIGVTGWVEAEERAAAEKFLVYLEQRRKKEPLVTTH